MNNTPSIVKGLEGCTSLFLHQVRSELENDSELNEKIYVFSNYFLKMTFNSEEANGLPFFIQEKDPIRFFEKNANKVFILNRMLSNLDTLFRERLLKTFSDYFNFLEEKTGQPDQEPGLSDSDSESPPDFNLSDLGPLNEEELCAIHKEIKIHFSPGHIPSRAEILFSALLNSKMENHPQCSQFFESCKKQFCKNARSELNIVNKITKFLKEELLPLLNKHYKNLKPFYNNPYPRNITLFIGMVPLERVTTHPSHSYQEDAQQCYEIKMDFSPAGR